MLSSHPPGWRSSRAAPRPWSASQPRGGAASPRLHAVRVLAVSTPRRDCNKPGLRKRVAVDLEGGAIPLNTHGVGKAGKEPPFVGKVLSVERLGGRDKERDVSQLVIDTGGVRFVEGQSFGVVPPVRVYGWGGVTPTHWCVRGWGGEGAGGLGCVAPLGGGGGCPAARRGGRRGT
jgi:hypothetical protein